jgi:aminotransferase
MPDRTSTKRKKAKKSSRQSAKSPLLARNARNGAPAPASHGKHFLSDKVGHFTESVIREMTRQAMLHHAVNLAQGFPDFPAPAEIK